MMERKLMAVGLACLLTSICIASILEGNKTRMITDIGDTVLTMITCDNGNIFNATGSGLRQAYWSYNGSRGGTITMPSGFYQLSSNFTITGNIVFEGQDAEGRSCTSNGTCINLSGPSTIILKEGKMHNIRINANANWTGRYALLLPGTLGHWEKMKMLDQIYVQNLGSTPRGVGIGMICNGTANLGGCDFGPLLVNNFNEGINISATGSGWINGNNFYNIQIDYCHFGMNMTNNGAGAGGNIFTSWSFQPSSTSNCKRAICINHGCTRNTFMGFDIWDAQYMPPIVAEIRGNDNMIIGGITAYSMMNQTTTRWNVTGLGNIIDRPSYESAVYQIYPTGWHDGTMIKANLNHIAYTGCGKIVFMPGTYDIDTTVSRTNTRLEYQFSRGVYFRANPAFSNNDFMELGPGDIAYGPAVFDGNNVAHYGIRIYGGNVTIRDITFKNFTTSGIYISSYNNLLVENCRFSNDVIGVKLNNAKSVAITLNTFNCTTAVSGYDSTDIISNNRGFNYNSNDVSSPIKYVIYNDTSTKTFKCVNKINGTVLFSSKNPSIVINSTLAYIKNEGSSSGTDMRSTIMLRGQFNMSTTINLTKQDYRYVTLKGDGCRFYYGGADPFFRSSEDNIDITFDNIVFDAGASSSSTRDGANNIFYSSAYPNIGSRLVYFTHCSFYDAKRDALHWQDSNTDGMFLEDCTFINNHYGVFLNRSAPFNTIHHCDFKSTNDYAIFSIGSSFYMTECVVSTIVVGANMTGGINPMGVMVDIEDNYFEWDKGNEPAINLTCTSPTCRLQSLVIKNNWFDSYNAKWDIYAPYIAYGITNTSAASLVVEGNRFQWANTPPIAYIYIKRCHAQVTMMNNLLKFGTPLVYTLDIIPPISWVYKADDNNVTIAPFGGNITLTGWVDINNVIKLTGRTTAPTPASEGMIYYDLTTHTLMLYTDTGWHSINIT